jgi:hypothetical protein
MPAPLSQTGDGEWTRDGWFHLTQSNGDVAGRVNCSFRCRKFVPTHVFNCTVVECSDVKKQSMFSMDRVYVTATADNRNRRTTTITRTDVEHKLVWSESDGELNWEVESSAPETVTLHLWRYQNRSKDKQIGSCKVPLPEILKAGADDSLVAQTLS